MEPGLALWLTKATNSLRDHSWLKWTSDFLITQHHHHSVSATLPHCHLVSSKQCVSEYVIVTGQTLSCYYLCELYTLLLQTSQASESLTPTAAAPFCQMLPTSSARVAVSTLTHEMRTCTEVKQSQKEGWREEPGREGATRRKMECKAAETREHVSNRRDWENNTKRTY